MPLVGVGVSQQTPPGYYRLAIAQIELKQHDEATDTIKTGLKVEPGGLLTMSTRWQSVDFFLNKGAWK